MDDCQTRIYRRFSCRCRIGLYYISERYYYDVLMSGDLTGLCLYMRLRTTEIQELHHEVSRVQKMNNCPHRRSSMICNV